MIAKLCGVIDSLFEASLLLNVGGVCYEVFCPNSVLHNAKVGENSSLWICHLIREDSQSLYGFLKYEEKLWFQELMRVHGVGAKMALSVVSALPLKEIYSAILDKDPHVLTQVSGIGLKVAERIIGDLKNSKLLKEKVVDDVIEESFQKTNVEIEVIEALTALGYDRFVAKKVVSLLPEKDGLSVEALLKMALSRV